MICTHTHIHTHAYTREIRGNEKMTNTSTFLRPRESSSGERAGSQKRAIEEKEEEKNIPNKTQEEQDEDTRLARRSWRERSESR